MLNPNDLPLDITHKVRDACLCLHVQRAARALARRYDEALRPLDLTSGQFSLMMSLNRPEPPSMGSVSALLAMDHTTLTANLKPLERRGLVKVTIGEKDKRSHLLTLMPAGRALLAAAYPAWERTQARAFRPARHSSPPWRHITMATYNEELMKAGVLLAAEGLQPSSKGARVRFSGSERTMIDGPFAETKELVAGFWIFQVTSKEAIEWVKRCPNPHDEETEIEIRPVFEAEDFGDALTPELRDRRSGCAEGPLGARESEPPSRPARGPFGSPRSRRQQQETAK